MSNTPHVSRPLRFSGRASLPAQVGQLLRKDASIEWRTRETLITLLFFSLVLVVIFSFSFWTSKEVASQLLPGIVWVCIAFSGTIAIDRSFASEHEGQTLTALILIPNIARALYISKTLVNIIYMALIECLIVPATVWILGLSFTWAEVSRIALTLALGTIGFAAVGTVFSAMLVAIQRRGVLLPVVLYPVAIPLLVMGVKALQTLVERRPSEQFWSWIQMMAAVDVLYLVAGLWLFGSILHDD